MPTYPWAADSFTHVRGTGPVTPLYTVDLPLNSGIPRVPGPFWDVEVSLDGGRRPYATAKFKATTAVMADPGTIGPFLRSSPYGSGYAVMISAGYQRTVGPDVWPVFVGTIKSRTVERDGDGNEYVQFEAESFDTALDFPSNVPDFSVPSDATSVDDVAVELQLGGTPLWHQIVIEEEGGYMNTPTAGQLVALRGLTLKRNDNLMDFLTGCALAVGQWARPLCRRADTIPTLVVCADPYPYRAATSLSASDCEKLTRVESLDQWANVLELTCTWTNSSNETLTRKRTYTEGGADPVPPIRARSVTVNAYPPGGVMPASYPLATAWLRRIGAMQEVKYTATTRAMPWIQPRIDGLVLDANPYGDTAGPVDSIRFMVDQGLMTVTWTADNPYTGV